MVYILYLNSELKLSIGDFLKLFYFSTTFSNYYFFYSYSYFFILNIPKRLFPEAPKDAKPEPGEVSSIVVFDFLNRSISGFGFGSFPANFLAANMAANGFGLLGGAGGGFDYYTLKISLESGIVKPSEP